MIRIGALAVESLQAMEGNRGSSIIRILDTAQPGAVVLELLRWGTKRGIQKSSLDQKIQPIPPSSGTQDVGRRLELDRPTKTTFTPLGLDAGTNI